MRQVLLIVCAVVAALVLSQVLFEFYQWNRSQACATSGGRNCSGVPTPINR